MATHEHDVPDTRSTTRTTDAAGPSPAPPAPPTQRTGRDRLEVGPGDTVAVRGATDGVRREADHGSIDVPATLAGLLATIGALVLLAGVVGAVLGGIGFQTGVDDQDLSVGGLVAGLVVLALACLLGGWVAARASGGRRGGLHGLLVVLWLVVLVALLSGLAALAGEEYDLVDRLGLPQWFTSAATSLPALLTGLGALVLAFAAGWLGGRWGERSARRRAAAAPVEVVETHRHVDVHDGGLGHRA